MNSLNKQSIEWAIEFTEKHSDGDLFPKILEFEAISKYKNYFIDLVLKQQLAEIGTMPSRRFIVPKDEVSYRQATQLHPQDTILASAIIYQFGKGIESRRLSKDKVLSYRFKPEIEDGLYSSKTAWNDFWTTVHKKSTSSSAILYCDIADFYNQIYHHVVENQLRESFLPEDAIKYLIKLLTSTTAGVSRGVPIGPHSIHLIAEATLIPIDNSLTTHGLEFCRYADDIVIFCESDSAARSALSQVASVLDQQQRLMLQRHKTKIYSPKEFQKKCNSMIEDRPIDKNEARLLGIIKKYSGGSPYQAITYESIQENDWAQFSEETVSRIITEYISKKEIDFIRLRWFYRRLSQIGHPGALKISIQNIEILGPCLATICTYFASIQSIEPGEWRQIGNDLIDLLDTELIIKNEFFRLSLLSLFSKNQYINHFTMLVRRFQNSDQFARREILLSGLQNNAVDWLRELKETAQHMDPWQKIAFIFCVSTLPNDEKKHFLKLKVNCNGPFEKTLSKWSLENPSRMDTES